MRRLISELSEDSSDSPSYLTKAGVLMRLVRDHVREEEDILFPQIESALEPGLAEELRIALERVHDARAAGAADAGAGPRRILRRRRLVGREPAHAGPAGRPIRGRRDPTHAGSLT